MRPRLDNCPSGLRARERGVALVVSLLMLSVVTFIAIAFLAVSNRERSSVTIAAQRAGAKLVAEAMLARAQSELLAQMISTTNRYDYGLKVSTNLVTPNGFGLDQLGQQFKNTADPLNVGYHDNSGRLINMSEATLLQNLANLQYDARAPVFIRTNTSVPEVPSDYDFRYYLDFNRNGMYDTNGYLNEVDENGAPVLDANKKIVTRKLVGDPEWIGFLEYPDRPHGPTNRFIGRGAYVVLPLGKSLDLNFMHNQAKLNHTGAPVGTEPENDYNHFYRNQGVGTWELNLASFLVDLNNNIWWSPNGDGINSKSNYFYNTAPGRAQVNESRGSAFQDARDLVNYRYQYDYQHLQSAANVLGLPASNPTQNNPIEQALVDLYSDGALMNGSRWQVPYPLPLQFPSLPDKPLALGWAGSFSLFTNNLTPFQDIQELFTTVLPVLDPPYYVPNNKLAERPYSNFRDSLLAIGRTNFQHPSPPAPAPGSYQPATTNRYTFYRMLDQLGVDSVNYNEAPGGAAGQFDQTGTTNSLGRVGAGRIDINFDNIDVGASEMRAWEPLRFFTNAAHRLLRLYYPTNNNPDSYNASDPVTGQPAGNPNGIYGTNGLSLTGTNALTGWTNFQIFPRNTYTPNVHRLLQLAANIYDATRSNGTNSQNGSIKNVLPTVPSVFRPIFYRDTTVSSQPSISIAGYVQVTETNNLDELFFSKNPWYDAGDLATNGLTHGGSQDSDGVIRNINIYGVPVVVGVKKYLPNFNEFAMQTYVEAARRLELVKTGTLGQYQTNVAFTLSVSNVLGMEIANTYTQAYPRRLEIRATNFHSWAITNSAGLVVASGSGSTGNLFSANMAMRRSPFTKYNQSIPAGNFYGGDFITNIAMIRVLPESIYLTTPTPVFKPWPSNDVNAAAALFEPLTANVLSADLTLLITNSFRCIIVDQDTYDSQYRVIDCVNLPDMTAKIDLGSLFRGTNTPYNIAGGNPGANSGQSISLRDLFDTNFVQNSTVPNGIRYQMLVSTLDPSTINLTGGASWKNYKSYDIKREIDGFRVFMGLNPIGGGNQTPINGSTNQTRKQSPFVPFVAKELDYYWQANDPLIHYTAGDLLTATNDTVNQPRTADPMPYGTFNIGRANDRYEPWGKAGGKGTGFGKTNAYNFAIKDPGITKPDDWDFPANASLTPGSQDDYPTNYFANVGWLGRVHRGTPWQTVYLKSGYYRDNNGSIRSTRLLDNNGAPVLDTNGVAVTNFNYLIPPRDWFRYAGSYESHPTNDWKLFDIFTATYGPNSERGLLSVNQTNIAAWSAVLGGVMVLSNNQYAANTTTPLSFADLPIDPSGPQTPQLFQIVQAINDYRATNFIGGVFTNIGGILGVPELTTYSPYLKEANPSFLPAGDSTTVTEGQIPYGMTDAAYERIPQQVLGLLQLEKFPRFVVYAYGQALRPAERSVFVDPTVNILRLDGPPSAGGTVPEPARGMCTNYQITAEVALRVQFRVEGMPNGVGPSAKIDPNNPPRVVIESYKLLPAIEY